MRFGVKSTQSGDLTQNTSRFTTAEAPTGPEGRLERFLSPPVTPWVRPRHRVDYPLDVGGGGLGPPVLVSLLSSPCPRGDDFGPAIPATPSPTTSGCKCLSYELFSNNKGPDNTRSTRPPPNRGGSTRDLVVAGVSCRPPETRPPPTRSAVGVVSTRNSGLGVDPPSGVQDLRCMGSRPPHRRGVQGRSGTPPPRRRG